MLVNVHLPMIYAGSGSNGNWELSMIEGMIGIAVFTENVTLFNHSVTYWYQRVPAYFYYSAWDGPKPVPIPRGSVTVTVWGTKPNSIQLVFNSSVDGISQETCRDLGHTQYGIGSTLNTAETARIQGYDLYGNQSARLRAALEFNSYYLLNISAPPSYICNGSGIQIIDEYPTMEIGYNNYHNRSGYSLPNTLNQIVTDVRPQPVLTDYHIFVWETLTHGGSPAPAAATTTTTGRAGSGNATTTGSTTGVPRGGTTTRASTTATSGASNLGPTVCIVVALFLVWVAM